MVLFCHRRKEEKVSKSELTQLSLSLALFSLDCRGRISRILRGRYRGEEQELWLET